MIPLHIYNYLFQPMPRRIAELLAVMAGDSPWRIGTFST